MYDLGGETVTTVSAWPGDPEFDSREDQVGLRISWFGPSLGVLDSVLELTSIRYLLVWVQLIGLVVEHYFHIYLF